MARLSAGMIGETSVRLRVDDWPNCALWLRSTPPVQTPVEVFALAPVGTPGSEGTWILDVEDLTLGQTYTFQIDGYSDPDGGTTIRTPSRSLAKGGLVIALLSCYFPSEEYEANPGRVLRCLDTRAGDRLDELVPNLKIFCGDQIYADVPWSWGFESPTLVYSHLYRKAWSRGRLGSLVSRGANAFVSEDHELWNSFPDQMPYLVRSGTQWFDWATAAAEAAWVEQGVWNFAKGFRGGASRRRGWGQTTLAGVDMFMADTRTDRVSLSGARCYLDTSTMGEHTSESRRRAMGDDQLKALCSWAAAVARIGVLVLGQPLLAPTTGPWSFDTTLADYETDYEAIVTALRRNIEERGVSFIVLTGDIHWGRLVYWSPLRSSASRPNAKLVEFVASPIARVGGVKSLFSRKHDVGKPAATTIKARDRQLLRRFLPGFTETGVFATGDNNFGILSLSTSGGDRYEAAFELWSLTTQAPAQNDWLNTSRCVRDSLEL